MRSFDVISTEQGGVEIVMVPIHDAALMLQFKGKAIFIDPETESYPDLPSPDLILHTVAPSPQKFGETTIAIAGTGYLFSMAGRRIYISGKTLQPDIANTDVAFISAADISLAVATIATIKPRIVYPYRYGAKNEKAVAAAIRSNATTEVRLRKWY